MREILLKIYDLVKKKYKKYSRSFLFSFLLNLLILVFYLHFFYPYYESNDDFSLKAIVSGLYGFSEVHMVYMNIILGCLFRTLYAIAPQLPWYDYVQYGLNLLSLSVISYVILNGKKHHSILMTAVVVVSYSLYVRPQYSKMASLMAIAGILLLKYACEKESTALKHISVFFLVIGSCVRDMQFFSCALICFGVLFFDLLGIFKDKKTSAYKHAFSMLKVGILSLLLIGCTMLADKLAYQNQLWSYYSEYNKARTELFDYGFPS